MQSQELNILKLKLHIIDLMKISILQTNIKWADCEYNRNQAELLLNKAQDSDLYVLPEMWSTGFVTSPEGIAEEDEYSLNWMIEQAKMHNAAICGSVSIKNDGYRNRNYFVFPDGTFKYYDKRHLFSFGGENANYEHGCSRVIVEWKGYRCLLLTCYDLRFPVWCRNQDDYDVIIIVANWPESRKHVWDTLLKARAIENQCFVIASNRVGQDNSSIYIGGSYVIDAKGKIISQNHTEDEEIISATISHNDLDNFRNKFRVLSDRDEFKLCK